MAPDKAGPPDSEIAPRLSQVEREQPDTSSTEETDPRALALLEDALASRASDIHLDPAPGQVRVRFRIDGSLVDAVNLPEESGLRLLRHFKVSSGLDPADLLTPADARFRAEVHGEKMDVRLSCAPCLHGDKLALRLLRRSPVTMDLEGLGFDADALQSIRLWLDDLSGMFVVAGPVGSGKTTTLYSLLTQLDLDRQNLVTIEDPVEYQIDGINQMELNESRGMTLDEAVHAVLRLDPDYLLLGEIQDRATVRAAIDAAGTGRVVLTTMHSRNAAGVITALRGSGVPDHTIAASLGFIVAQRLVRRLCEKCKVEDKPGEAVARWLDQIGQEVPDLVWQAPGCEECGGIGYRGRIGVFETLPINEEAYRLIMAGEDEHHFRRHLRDNGFKPMLFDGLEKARQGITDYAELSRMGAQSYLEAAFSATPKGDE